MRKQISRSVSGIIIVSSVVFSQPASAFFEAPTPQPTAEDKAWLEENSHDGVFPDYTTRLVWQDNVDVVTHKRALTGDAQAGDTSGSGLSAREYCEHLELAGYDNWELPTKTQMEHLYRVFSDQLVHENRGVYWSSTRFTPTPNMSRVVSAANPGMGNNLHEESAAFQVRCVRRSR